MDSHSLFLYREKSSIINRISKGKTIAHNFLIYAKFQEIGCGEIKANHAEEKLQEEDRVRLGEHLKRQLHRRIKEAKSEREFHIFCIFISDKLKEQ